jgi:pseudouridine synthase
MTDQDVTTPHDEDTGTQRNDQQERGERLQKFLAHAGIASRRHAEELIQAGVVTVNGAVVGELGTRVDPQRDDVRVRGRRVSLPETHLYVAMNKPEGIITTATDPRGRRTVLDILPAGWRSQRVYPVGRLDRDSEGLLLLTNDGEFAFRLAHPRFSLPKEYHALIEGEPSPEALDQLRQGVLMRGEQRPTSPAKVRVIHRHEHATWVSVEIHEGRNRQVRRMFEAVGYRVVRLQRVRVGPLELGNLRPGKSRPLTEAEVQALRAVAFPPDKPAPRTPASQPESI